MSTVSDTGGSHTPPPVLELMVNIDNVEEPNDHTDPSGAGDNIDIQPEDSVSNINISTVSSKKSKSSETASVIKLKNKQKEIELRLELVALRESSILEEEKLRIENRQREITLRAKIKAAQEIDEMLQGESAVAFRKASRPTFPTNPNYRSQPENSLNYELKDQFVPLNPDAKDFVPVKETTQSQELMGVFQKLIENQRDQALPDQEISTFDGTDVLQYETFINNFEMVIESHTKDSSRRIQFLLKYTKGEAHDLIQYTPLIKDPLEAYEEARRLLQRDYGNPQLVASAFMSKAETLEKIKNGDKLALRKFAIFLVNCVNSKRNNREMDCMDGSECIKMLCEKLPFSMQQKWISENGKIREYQNRSPTLKDFESFVGLLSRNENDPRVSGLGYQHSPKTLQHPSKTFQHQNKHNVPQRKVFTTQVKSNLETTKENLAAKSPCLYCGAESRHCLLDCRKFSSLTSEEKSNSVRKRGLCYGCLNPGHMKQSCDNPEWSKCNLCTRSHPTIMHDPSKHVKSEVTNSKAVTSSCAKTNSSSKENCDPLMAILPVKVRNPANGYHMNTYAFVDNGFSSVFVADELNRVLQFRSSNVNLSVKTVNSEQTVKSGHITDTICVSDIKGESENPIKITSAYTRSTMPVTMDDAPTQQDINRWEHLSHIKLPHLSGVCIPNVTLMIGMSVPSATTPLEIIKGEIGEPYAIRSPLGYLFYGLPGKLTAKNHTSVNFCQPTLDSSLEKQVKAYFNLEFSERLSEVKQCMSQEDKKFMNIMDKTTVFENGHYKMDIPFRDPNKTVPNNRVQAELYAHRLQKRLASDNVMYQQYVSFMNKLELHNYCEKVPIYDLERSDGRVWYVPHIPVTNVNKPNKLRVVFNCPIIYKDVSLNSMIYPGPNLANGLLGVILRWRERPYAIMADIETMFYRVRVSDKDTDMLRFLWWPQGELNGQLTDYRMLVHIFGAVSSPSCCNYALKRVATDNKDVISEVVAESIKNDFYVDDFLKSVETETEAIDIAKQLCDILKASGFNLTKWISNSRNFLKTVPESELVEETKNLDFESDDLPIQRALGVKWCTEMDKIRFNISEMISKPTRRNILSVMSSVYDPIGFAAPFILRCKIIIQNLCRLNLSWDQDIPDTYKCEWKSWLSELSKLKDFSVDRCLKPKSFSDIVNTQIHHFADASQDAYASVSYVRYVNKSGEIHVSFVLGRSRVAPLRPHTIVKLELSAATSIVRINNMLTSELSIPIDQIYFWTDSQTVLKYIANETSRHQVFVSNRLAVIRDGSDIHQWRYIPSKLNPADQASRGLSAEDLTSVNWINGPAFLSQPESSWPENIVLCESNTCGENVNNQISSNSIKISEVAKNSINQFISHYSDYKRLLRGVSWILRLKNILKLKAKNSEIPDYLIGKTLTNQEVLSAEKSLLNIVQRVEFLDEFQSLTSSDSEAGVKHKSSISNLDPKIIDGLICVGGRLCNASIPDSAKNQIILPKSHCVSRLIVNDCHRKVGHQGRNHTLAHIRQKYWIIQSGVIVKNVIRNCVVCKKLNSRVGQQKMADLPRCRVQSDQKAFTCVGIDFFGPYGIKVGRIVRKRYGVVFSCFTSRAVHIEITESMDTSSCVDAIRRFMARRGVPKDIYSDNGTNLVSASKELLASVKELDQDILHQLGIKFDFNWHFNPPAASHFGGVWERMIRTIRKILQALLNEQFLKSNQSEEKLRTFMCEVESIINSRPLTRVSDDPNDLNVITPNSLLLYEPLVTYPPGLYNEKDIYARRRWRQMQYLAQVFWKRWTKEYLPLLQQRQKWLQPKRNFKVGDIALIVDDNAPRLSWPLGLITEAYPNKNGLVRSVKLKTQYNILVRPIDKLCLLLEGNEN